MTLNPNVDIDTSFSQYVDRFTPDIGYALWDDTEEGNLDENGQPIRFWLSMDIQKRFSEAKAPHIWAQLIDETMEVFGKIPGMEEVSTFGLRNPETSHTYIDENGVERMKKGVY